MAHFIEFCKLLLPYMYFGNFNILLLIKAISWVLIYDKGYQETDEAVSTAVTKTKGLLVQKAPNNTNAFPYIYDGSEIVVPPLENDAFFIVTHSIVTPMQKAGLCPAV